VAEIVGEQDDDVGALLRLGGDAEKREKESEEGEGGVEPAEHGWGHGR